MKIESTLVHTGVNRKIFSHSSRLGHIVSMGSCKVSFLVQRRPIDCCGFLGTFSGKQEVTVLSHLLSSNDFQGFMGSFCRGMC